jgi:hypothetical protein
MFTVMNSEWRGSESDPAEEEGVGGSDSMGSVAVWAASKGSWVMAMG